MFEFWNTEHKTEINGRWVPARPENYKWLCTAKVFEGEDGNLRVEISGPSKFGSGGINAHFMMAAESVKREIRKSMTPDEREEYKRVLDVSPYVAPTDPKTT